MLTIAIGRLIGLEVALTNVGVIQEAETVILSADKTLTNTERISQMFESNPSFNGNSGTVKVKSKSKTET